MVHWSSCVLYTTKCQVVLKKHVNSGIGLVTLAVKYTFGDCSLRPQLYGVLVLHDVTLIIIPTNNTQENCHKLIPYEALFEYKLEGCGRGGIRAPDTVVRSHVQRYNLSTLPTFVGKNDCQR